MNTRNCEENSTFCQHDTSTSIFFVVTYNRNITVYRHTAVIIHVYSYYVGYLQQKLKNQVLVVKAKSSLVPRLSPKTEGESLVSIRM